MNNATAKATFTPGPYNIRPLKGPYGYDVEIDVEPDCTWQVARVNGHTPEQALANAHLIAAAPELLAACKAIVVRLPPAFADNIAQLNAAIQKAEARNG